MSGDLKFWCHIKSLPEKISGIWNFTNGLLSKGYPVLTQQDADNITGTIYTHNAVGIIPFNATSDSSKLTINNWQTTYGVYLKNGKFIVQFLDSDNNIQDRPDVAITRIINRSGISPIQTGITMDYPFRPKGQIVIQYFDFRLL